ncbi:bifunctional riboflavin kinase/FAD synthetase [Brachybacterium endophyticum]|uniref:Riboflavin biosynthesis protein n=1 Tax=Brachybacterium endophyticum TaxID=2182385 RepID=A0A2U2RLJ2_9MICO|nr:bifunctional riboflavin kinase/FAD synthetase [Brachybacterium endophyticum]PWH06747.1 bifunctional riboflavin kinase/FAD synthetase [Brachybacterium endophyticum]
MTRAQIWHSLEEVPADLGASAVTIGNFDGVHLGHRYVLDALRDNAAARSLEPVALTFWPHPRHVMQTPGEPPLITAHTDRDRLLLLAGMNGVLDLEFTWDFAQYSAEEFVRVFLVEGLGMRCIVTGSDTRFGRANAGDVDTLLELGRRYGFDVVVLPDLSPGETAATDAAAIDAGPLDARSPGEPGPAEAPRISSSAIREALLSGEIPEATAMLGRFHTVADVVHHGFKRGRELGFPTANLGPMPQGLVPADGVYAGFLTVVEQSQEHRGAPPLVGARTTISIGTNPTFHEGSEESPRMVEAYVHGDNSLDLYGDTVRLEFVERQRPTLRFSSVNALVAQMELDKDVTRRTLESVQSDVLHRR